MPIEQSTVLTNPGYNDFNQNDMIDLTNYPTGTIADVYGDAPNGNPLVLMPPPPPIIMADKAVKKHHAKVLKFKTRSAKPSEPSVLWISKTGKYYRTVIQARIDHPTKAVIYNPYTGTVTVPPVTNGGTTGTSPGTGTTQVGAAVPTSDSTTVPTAGKGAETITPAVASGATKTNTAMYVFIGVIAILIIIKIIK